MTCCMFGNASCRVGRLDALPYTLHGPESCSTVPGTYVFPSTPHALHQRQLGTGIRNAAFLHKHGQRVLGRRWDPWASCTLYVEAEGL